MHVYTKKYDVLIKGQIQTTGANRYFIPTSFWHSYWESSWKILSENSVSTTPAQSAQGRQ